ncbi:hypothetical protein EVG20_g3164 [Dentipellis fragilis]|uniref:Transcription initiation factor TFIID subunit 8 n=1 Tax=Dentipellis fragilis TaxID=205917 RepID=A0A4Y9Z5Q9_9AGAM|nr:hypothetical protein EVG20_g3164 [Dentipellis fragilis]
MSSYPTSQPFTQPYGSYQQTYAHYPSQTHYPSANYSQVPQQTPSFVYSAAQPPQTPQSSSDDVPPSPDPLNMTPEIASKTLQRFISAQVKDEGFDAAEPNALRQLELEVVAFVEELHRRAHEYANLANRTSPMGADVLLAWEDYGMDTEHIGLLSKEIKEHHKSQVPPLQLIPASQESPLPKMLSSEDEGSQPTVPATLRTIPHYYPPLPPKHTYLRTPPSPPKRQALPSLEKRLKNASLVQESLRNLMLSTEETIGPDDGELLGAIVNWEATRPNRKRWRIGSH